MTGFWEIGEKKIAKNQVLAFLQYGVSIMGFVNQSNE